MIEEEEEHSHGTDLAGRPEDIELPDRRNFGAQTRQTGQGAAYIQSYEAYSRYAR